MCTGTREPRTTRLCNTREGAGATQTEWGSIVGWKSVGKAALSVPERQPAGLRLARGPEPEDKERVGMRSWRACRSHTHLRGVRGGLRVGTALGSL